MQTLKERLDAFLKEKNLSQGRFAEATGLSNGFANNVGDSISTKSLSKIQKAFPDLNPLWLTSGEGEMLSADKDDLEVNQIYHPKYTEKVEDQLSVPLYDLEATASLAELFTNREENILGQISIPNIPVCDGAVHVRGDSMYPLLKSGDIVAYKIVPNEMQYIIFGEMYLLSIDMMGDEYLTVKYIQQSEKGKDWVKLVSYNTHHQPKDFPLSSIKAMALVKFSIRMNTMS
ncbi:MAG: S24 family peptidase [Bacteroides sp.]